MTAGPRTLLLAVTAMGLAARPGAGTAEWRTADPSYRLELPRDHASHPDYRIEWWYYTGNVTAAGGRRFGYQVTFFRVGVDRHPANPSRWSVRDLHMAHLAVTDIDGRRFRFADRLNRTGIGWAGAATDRYDVWNEDWRATLDDAGRHRLVAAQDGLQVDLTLEPGKPWVAQGRDGYSRKGPSPGNASHYYSLTRMPTRGRLALDGAPFVVEGSSWMDHEFGSSFLEPDQVGWNWCSLQLDDGTDVMLYEMRRRDGRLDPYSIGTVVSRDGRAEPIAAGDFRLTPGDTWRSPASGATYPIAWSVAVPRRGLALDVRAALPDQELRTGQSTGVTYWEGSVVVGGTSGGRPVSGRGYLEMTGYTGAPLSSVLR
jgi:predicted secreted hydrolase